MVFWHDLWNQVLHTSHSTASSSSFTITSQFGHVSVSSSILGVALSFDLLSILAICSGCPVVCAVSSELTISNYMIPLAAVQTTRKQETCRLRYAAYGSCVICVDKAILLMLT